VLKIALYTLEKRNMTAPFVPFFNSKSLGESIAIDDIAGLQPAACRSVLAETEEVIRDLEDTLAEPGDFNRHRITTKLRLTYAARNQCLLALGQEVPPSGYSKLERTHDRLTKEALNQKLIDHLGLTVLRRLETEARQVALGRLESWAKSQSDISPSAIKNYVNGNK
jgi:hypothetical protein